MEKLVHFEWKRISIGFYVAVEKPGANHLRTGMEVIKTQFLAKHCRAASSPFAEPPFGRWAQGGGTTVIENADGRCHEDFSALSKELECACLAAGTGIVRLGPILTSAIWIPGSRNPGSSPRNPATIMNYGSDGRTKCNQVQDQWYDTLDVILLDPQKTPGPADIADPAFWWAVPGAEGRVYFTASITYVCSESILARL